jgi:hypothetical protein
MNRTAEEVVQQNVQCYNGRDIDGFMSTFTDDISLYLFGEDSPTVAGIDNIKKFYENLFDVSPKLHATILNRIAFDNKVIDHERITGRMGSDEVLELVVIYELKNGKICRVTAIRS